jgi:hypothetical protein
VAAVEVLVTAVESIRRRIGSLIKLPAKLLLLLLIFLAVRATRQQHKLPMVIVMEGKHVEGMAMINSSSHQLSN